MMRFKTISSLFLVFFVFSSAQLFAMKANRKKRKGEWLRVVAPTVALAAAYNQGVADGQKMKKIKGSMNGMRGFNAIVRAIKAGELDEVREIIDAGYDVNFVCNRKGYSTPATALLCAAELCSPDMVRLLLDTGAQPDVTSNEGFSALMELVRGVVSNSCRNASKRVPFDPVATARLLCEAGVDLEMSDNHGFRCIDQLLRALYNRKRHVSQRPSPALSNKGRAIIKLFLEYGADVSHTYLRFDVSLGHVLFGYACQEGLLDLVEALLQRDVDPNGEDYRGKSPWDYCIELERIDLLRLLVNHVGGVQNARNFIRRDGETLLHVAVGRHSLALVKEIISLGADLNARDAEGQTPFDLARRLRLDDIEKYIEQITTVQQREKEERFMKAVCANDINELQACLDKGIDVNCVVNGPFGNESALHVAARSGYYKVVHLLCGAGADTNASFGREPVLFSTIRRFSSGLSMGDVTDADYVQTIRELCEYGADVNAVYDRMRSIDVLLSCSCMIGFRRGGEYWEARSNSKAECAIEVVNILIAYGLNHNIQLKSAKTSCKTLLEWACEARCFGIAAELVCRGGELHRGSIWRYALESVDLLEALLSRDGGLENAWFDRRQDGGVILHKAVENRNIGVVKLLLSHGVDLNRRDQFRRTALEIAQRHNLEEIAQLILDAQSMRNDSKNTSCVAAWTAPSQVQSLSRLHATSNTPPPLPLRPDSNQILNPAQSSSRAVAVPVNTGLPPQMIFPTMPITAVTVSATTTTSTKSSGKSKKTLDAESFSAAEIELMSAQAEGLYKMIRQRDYVGVREVLNGADRETIESIVSFEGAQGERTALHVAAQQDDARILRLLVNTGGADIDHRSTQGSTSLHDATMYSASSCIAALIEMGASLNHRLTEGEIKIKGKNVPVDGWSALHCAVSQNDAGIVEQLLQAGALLQEDACGNTPYDLAILCQHTQVAELLEHADQPPAYEEHGGQGVRVVFPVKQ